VDYLLVYCCMYTFFAWILVPPASIIFIILNSRSDNDFISTILKKFFIYTISFITVSIPGLISIFSSPLDSTYQIPQEVPLYFFISPLLIILTAVLAFMELKRNQTATAFALSLIISTIIVMNIQPVSGKLIAPYHFLLFYVVPFLSVFLVAVILKQFKDNLLFRRTIFALLTGLFIFKLSNQYLSSMHGFHNDKGSMELVEHIKSIKTDNEVFAIFPHFEAARHWWSLYPSRRTTPYYIQYLSEKPLFPFNYEFFDPEEQLYVNYLIYNLFRGDSPSLDTYIEEEIYYPDYAYGIVSFEAVRRRNILLKHKNNLDTILSREMLPFQIKYLIAEPLMYPSLYSYVKKQHEEIWRSSDNKYVLFRRESSSIQEAQSHQQNQKSDQ
jgi:hypothetical protein